MRKKILICDDEEGVRESLKLILEKDYDLIFSTNGNEAIDVMKRENIDAVLIDIKMPRMDGIETIGKLKEIRPDAKIVVASGYKSVETAKEAVNAGAVNYVVKPFDRVQLLKTVKALF